MASDAQIRPETQSPEVPRSRLLAPWWHTLIVVAVLLLLSFGSARGSFSSAGKTQQYVQTIAAEWVLLGVIWLGVRKRMRLRELIGGRWATLEDFLLDVVYAAVFWGVAMLVLGVSAKLLGFDQPGKIESMRKQLGFLAPDSTLQLIVWYCVSATAGFCEEIIFRGYLQRQLAAMGNSLLLGVLLSALIFGASHGYEGAARMFLIAIFGLLFGLLAWWRKSLRAGMMAHAWHDALSGTILRMLK